MAVGEINEDVIMVNQLSIGQKRLEVTGEKQEVWDLAGRDLDRDLWEWESHSPRAFAPLRLQPR